LNSSLEKIDLPDGLGGAPVIQFAATKYEQGGRIMYNLVLPLVSLPRLIERPDPNRPLEDNRKVNLKHAEGFRDYIVRQNPWIAPAIIVRAVSTEMSFEVKADQAQGVQYGILSIPAHVLPEIKILDGQHRTLGIFLAIEQVNSQIADKAEYVQKARVLGEPNAIAEAEKALKIWTATRERFGRQHISVDIAIVGKSESSQLFADINTNSLAVNKDFTTVLDQRHVGNRIAMRVMKEHPLVDGRIETGQSTRMTSSNPNFLGARHLADIVRVILVGGSGRISARREQELESMEDGAVHQVVAFLDTLTESFKDLAAMADGNFDALTLRRESLLGSVTMIRALAAVYFELRKPGEGQFVHEQVVTYFKSLDAHMREVPVMASDEFWMSTGAFAPNGMAPLARQGDVVKLVTSLLERAR
jgi:hypothetical protein